MHDPLPVRPQRRPLERLPNALPDAITAGYFAVLWCAPLAFGDHGVRNAMLMMLVEFIVIHASGFLGSAAILLKVSRRTRLMMLIGFALFYLLFIAAWSYVFKAWWPFLAFGWLWVGKAAVALDKRRPPIERQVRMLGGWALSVLFYLFGVVLTGVVPLPRLGLAGVGLARLDLPGSGAWVEQPHTVLAFGVVYFGLLTWSKWRDWGLPIDRLPLARMGANRTDG